MTRPIPGDEAAARAAAEVARRAIRRLDVLEWVTFAGAFVIAILGGAVIAWMVAQTAGWAFRPTWIATSLLLFVLPGGFVILRTRRAEGLENRKDEDG